MKIQLILGSTREGRKGEKVAKWVLSELNKRAEAIVEFLDLKDFPLPYYAEAKTPSSLTIEEYTNDMAKKWVSKIEEGDAYIIITPEYNHGYPAVLKNALDYPYKQWNKKPVAFISYGSSANGARAVEQLRQVAVELQMAPIRNGVHISLGQKPFDENGNMIEEQKMHYEKSLTHLYDQLIWWATALKHARDSK